MSIHNILKALKGAFFISIESGSRGAKEKATPEIQEWP
jgi:hypothetical protein